MADLRLCSYYTGMVGTPIRYVTLQFWDRGDAASLRYSGAENCRFYV